MLKECATFGVRLNGAAIFVEDLYTDSFNFREYASPAGQDDASTIPTARSLRVDEQGRFFSESYTTISNFRDGLVAGVRIAMAQALVNSG